MSSRPGNARLGVDVAEADQALSPPDGDGVALDQLLAEFDESQSANAAPVTLEAPASEPAVPTQQTAPEQRPPQRDNQIEARLNELQHQIVLEKAQRDMHSTVNAIRGERDAGIFNDSFMTTWIDNQARLNPALTQAWLGRHADPASFRRAVDHLSRKFEKEVVSRTPDREPTEDRAAVTAAVRGASAKQPEGAPPNYGRMSDNEFEAEKARMFGS
jgi:hypothetical protein